MSASLPNNAKNSGSTPSIEPPPRSEQELLKLRETQAKAAVRATARQIGRNLQHLVDLGPIVREHPWKSSGVAALAGFAVALKVLPASSHSGKNGAGSETPQDLGPSPWTTLTATLLDTGSGALKAALMPWLAQKLQDLIPKEKEKETKTAETSSPFEKEKNPHFSLSTDEIAETESVEDSSSPRSPE